MSKKNTVLLDIETSGFKADKNLLCELGFIVIDENGIELERYSTLIKPYELEEGTPMVVTEKAMEVNGLTLEQLENEGIEIEDAIKEAVAIFEKHEVSILMAHNAKFDSSFMFYLLEFFGTGYKFEKVFCTMEFAKKKVRVPSYSLTNLAKHFGIENKDAHRSIGDVETTWKLFNVLKSL
jgi:DNA polymerase III epsilon subunit-like protein